MGKILDLLMLVVDAAGALLRLDRTPPVQAAALGERGPQAALVPVRSLRPRHRAAVLAHLVGLSARDRYLRFGYAAQDAQIEAYVSGLNFDRDQIYGVFNRRLRLIAVAHLAYGGQSRPERRVEFGVSVSPDHRGKGLGTKLFARAQVHAQNNHVSQMFIHALSENAAMLKIARNAGAAVQRFGSESDAYLQLPSPTFDSYLSEAMEQQFADTDYRLKVQAHQFWGMLDSVRTLRQRLRRWHGKSPP
jgi:GNAT superfamily N-acetyltransferase